MEDLDNNQFQPNQPHDVADDTVTPNDAGNRANHDNDDIVHMMNNREWTDGQKHKIVEMDIQDRRRGKYQKYPEIPENTLNTNQLVGRSCEIVLLASRKTRR